MLVMPASTGTGSACLSVSMPAKKRKCLSAQSDTAIFKRRRSSSHRLGDFQAAAPNKCIEQKGNGVENEQKEDINVYPLQSAPAEVPEADPNQIEELWAEVRRSMSHPEAPGSMSAPSFIPQKRPSSDDPSTLPTSGPKSTMSGRSGTSTYTIKNARFREKVLNPRGIKIHKVPDTSSPFRAEEIFSESWSKVKELSDYPRLSGLEHLNIWATLQSARKIVEAYTIMGLRSACERQYASFAEEHLLKAPSFIDSDYEELKQGLPCAERILEFCLKEVEDFWFVPPIVDGSQPSQDESEWKANNRSDCSYWISLRLTSFSCDIPSNNFTPYVGEPVFYPYFTIEYKKSYKNQQEAEMQLAVAGSVALYNRFLLYQRASRKVQSTELPESLRHFGLAICGELFTFWELRPRTEIIGGYLEWRGCTMKMLGSLRLMSRTIGSKNTEKVGQWINEIHHWGLTAYFRQCVTDIKIDMGKGMSGGLASTASCASPHSTFVEATQQLATIPAFHPKAVAPESQDTTGGAERS